MQRTLADIVRSQYELRNKGAIMPKYIVQVLVTKIERWEVDAPDALLAADDYGEGRLLSCSDEECEIADVKPL